MTAEAIDQVRSFNRIVQERIGALDDRFLGRARPIADARVLWEIGSDGIDLRVLGARLRLDAACVGRAVRELATQGLARLDADGASVRLTADGLAEREELDRRSDGVAVDILSPLSASQREALVAAMAQVDRLLQASLVRVAVENPASADAAWCFAQYFRELDERFDVGFDPSASLPADANELSPPHGTLLLARLRDRPIGCAALKLHGGAPAEVKRMWVARSARGLGVGRRLLMEIERWARANGVRTLRLETNRALREAIALYRASGFVEVEAFNDEPYAHHWFEKTLQ